MELWSGGNLAELPPEAGKCVRVRVHAYVCGRPHRTPGTTPSGAATEQTGRGMPFSPHRRAETVTCRRMHIGEGVRSTTCAGVACVDGYRRRCVDLRACMHILSLCAQARAAGHSARVGPMESVAIGYRSRSRSGAHEAADAGLLRAPTDTQTDTHTRARTHAFPHSSTRTHARAHARSVN